MNWLPLGGQYVFTAQRPLEATPSSVDFSLVVPLYNEGENVIPVASGLAKALGEVCPSFELVLVDNSGESPRILDWHSARWGVVSLTEARGVTGNRDEPTRTAAYARMRESVAEAFAPFVAPF